jgi:hypothetical protein
MEDQHFSDKQNIPLKNTALPWNSQPIYTTSSLGLLVSWNTRVFGELTSFSHIHLQISPKSAANVSFLVLTSN